jgi:hypothetical protein
VEECRGHRCVILTAADSIIENSEAIVEVLLSVGGTGIIGRHTEYREGGFFFFLERCRLSGSFKSKILGKQKGPIYT